MHGYVAHGCAEAPQQQAGVGVNGTPATPAQLRQRSMQCALASPLRQEAASASPPAVQQAAFVAQQQPGSGASGPTERPASPLSSLLDELLSMEEEWPVLPPPQQGACGGPGPAQRPASPTSSLLEELLRLEGEWPSQQQPLQAPRQPPAQPFQGPQQPQPFQARLQAQPQPLKMPQQGRPPSSPFEGPQQAAQRLDQHQYGNGPLLFGFSGGLSPPPPLPR